MATVKELQAQLKPVDKTTISFDIPVLERIKLECMSFIGDEFIASPNGTDVTVGEYTYRLGVTNVYHHLSIGRALYKLVRMNPELGKVIDEKKLSVRLIGEEVSRLTRYYKDQAYFIAKEKGYGFESLNYHRLPDAVVDTEVLVEAIVFIKVEKPLEAIEIYSQDETTRLLRLELAKVEAKEEAKRKAESEARIGKAKVTKTPEKLSVKPDLVKPDRNDPKYSGLFGDVEYEADLAEYERKLAAQSTEASDTTVDVVDDLADEDLDNEDND